MKKFISVLLALTLIFSLSVTALAEDKGKITFGTDKSGGVLSKNEVLKPWQTYEFPIKLNGEVLTNEMGDKYKIRLENIKGKNAVKEIKVLKGAENYYLKLELMPLSYTQQTAVEYRLTMTNDTEKLTGDFGFMAGFPSVYDDYINNLSAGEDIRVNNDFPVFTREQLNRISEKNGWKNVSFVGDNWRYTVNVTDKGPANFLYNHNNIDDIISKYPQNDFLFLNFPAGPQFAQSTLTLDLAQYENSFTDKIYGYSYYNGKLTPLAVKFDKENLTAELTVYGLGQYLITDKPLSAAEIGGTANPNTGGRDIIAPLFIGLISSAVGAIALKKKIKE